MTRINILTLKDVLFSSATPWAKLIKVLDHSLGKLLVCLLRPKPFDGQKLDKNKISKILVIRPGGIGDAVLLVPLLKAIRETFCNSRIDVLAEKRNAQVFYLESNLADNVFNYDGLNLISLFRRLRKEKYDIVIDTEQWHNLSALFSYAVGRKIRVGFDTREMRSRLYTHLAPYSQKKRETDNFLEMLKVIPADNPSVPLRVPFIALPAELNDWAKKAVPHDRLVAICLSASIKERLWGIDNFKKISDYLIKKKYFLVFLGGSKETDNFRKIFNSISGREFVYDFVGKSDLSQTAALINISKFYIGLDTGILHIAYALDIPTISLFGPGIKDKWAPVGPKHIVIDKQLSCSPCTLFGYTRVCNDAVCMKEINPEDVIRAIDKIIHE